MKKYTLILLGILAIYSCNKKEKFDGPDFYQDGFESYEHIDSTIDGENIRWSFFQISQEGNSISIDSTFAHTGSKCIKSEAVAAPEGDASKASINKQFMAFWQGEVVRIDFWIYLVGNEPANWIFICDLEEKTPIGAGAGMRIAIVEDELTLEHKYPNPNIHQNDETAIKFPRNQWVNVTMETLFSTKKSGYVKIWQDGILVIDQPNWKTLPKDILYANQGSKKGYSQIEFGITANTYESDMVMYVDDILVEVVE